MKEIIITLISYWKESQRQRTIRKIDSTVEVLIHTIGSSSESSDMSKTSSFFIEYLKEIKTII